MAPDIAIHRMAFREAPSLALAQALVARKRAELELALAQEQAGLAMVLQRMDDDSRRASARLDRIA